MPESGSIISCFEEIAAHSPQATAMRWAAGSLSYAELNAQANQLAHFLIGAGVRPESMVGVSAVRSPETLVAFLAILKAGGAYVPLDPTFPPERIAFFLKDAAIQIVLTVPSAAGKMPTGSAKVIPLDLKSFASQPTTNPTVVLGSGSLANVLYTSGSTGQPKGVLLEHRGVVRLVRNMSWIEIRPDDVFLQFAPLGFDASTFEIWGAWLNGGCVAVPAEDVISLTDIAKALMDFKVTTAWLTAGLFHALVEEDITCFAGLRQLLTGGDIVSPAHAERFLRRHSQAILINGYGPTENTVFTSCHKIKLEAPMPSRLSIGRPIDGTDVLVMDEKLQPVEAGELGELVLTGSGLARGYLNQPALTEQTFVQVADSKGGTVRGYRSGDLGRYAADGTLDFHGRRDDQVKINGLRIEPGEIKNILQTHPNVSGAEVVLVEKNGRKALEIFAVLGTGRTVKESALRDFLAAKVPGNWMPPLIRIVPRLPLGPNGKTDRRALLAGIPAEKADAAGRVDEPDDALEKAIWGVWRDLLPAPFIDTHTRFAEFGGDSLTAMKMLAQVETIVGRPIGLESLLKGGTIADIAAAARASGPVKPPPEIVCMLAGHDRPPFFFAHGDYLFGGLYCHRVVQRMDPAQPFYALAPPGFFGGNLPPSFEAVAARYVELIRSVQPHGPYQIGGFCNGAIAMFEVAQQLMRADESVSVLVLMDPPDLYFFELRRKITTWGRWLGLKDQQCQSVYRRITEGVEIWQNYGAWRFAGDFMKRLVQWIFSSLGAAARRGTGRPAKPSTNLNFYFYEIMAAYQPQPLPQKTAVTVIMRDEDTHRSPKQVGYWGGLLAGTKFVSIPGSHIELKNCMDELTAVIEDALASPAVPEARTEALR